MKNSLLNEIMRKILVVAICCVVALFSIFVVAKKATSPETYKNTIESIDEKKVTVMGLQPQQQLLRLPWLQLLVMQQHQSQMKLWI